MAAYLYAMAAYLYAIAIAIAYLYCEFICDGREFICDGHDNMRWLRMHAMTKRIGDGDVLLVEATEKACQ